MATTTKIAAPWDADALAQIIQDACAQALATDNLRDDIVLNCDDLSLGTVALWGGWKTELSSDILPTATITAVIRSHFGSRLTAV